MTITSSLVTPGVVALAVAALATPWVRKLALIVGAVDLPGEARRVHQRPTPRLGGLAVYLAFVSVALSFVPWSRELFGLLAGLTIVLVVGAVDDARGLNPWVKLGWQLVAAMVALAGGLGITTLTNPFGGVIFLEWGRFSVQFLGLHFHVTPVANLLSLLWMVGLVNTINFLDGLDGLATGISGIAALVMFLVAVGPHVNQPVVAMLAIALAGAALGFLPYNFFPARIFLGDSGAYMLGLALAVLAIYSGAKLATAALVLGFTIFDGLWAVIRRLRAGRSPFASDRGHFHHLLLDAGLSQPRAVIIMYLIAIVFGAVALTANTLGKLVAIVILVGLMAASIFVLLISAARRSQPH